MKVFVRAVFLMLAMHAMGEDSIYNEMRGQSESSEVQAVEELGAIEETPLETVPYDAVEELGTIGKKGDSSKSKKKPTRKPTPNKPDSSKSKKKPTRKPTRRPSPDSSKSRKTRRPTRQPTGRPTRPSPSSTKSSKNSKTSRCVDDERPRARRDGQRYRFRLVRSDGKCVDKDGRPEEYGQFRDVEDFSDCADKCVKDVRSSVLDSFRGYDYDCDRRRCNCLYDRGALDRRRNRDRFDRTSRGDRGRGSIEYAKKEKGYYCAKLSGAEFAGYGVDEIEFEGEALAA